MIDVDSLVAALAFAGIFLLGRRVHVLRSRRAALSLGAGVSTAYVFIHMLPEMAEASNVFVEATSSLALPWPELRIYAAALVGFLIFYGLENLVAWKRTRVERDDAEGEGLGAVFFLHVGGFALYVSLVSYLMVHGISENAVPVALYAVAMGLHFLGIGHSLEREHGETYDRIGRFILAAAAVLGWVSGVAIGIPKTALVTGLGLVSGGVVMNSMIMELPSEKDGRFWPFVTGAAGYTALLASIR